MNTLLLTYPSAPGYKAPGCSKDAAGAMAPKATALRKLCMAALSDGPATADEIAAKLGRSILSIRPRFTDLKNRGLIVATTARRPSSEGSPMTVWRCVGAGN